MRSGSMHTCRGVECESSSAFRKHGIGLVGHERGDLQRRFERGSHERNARASADENDSLYRRVDRRGSLSRELGYAVDPRS